MNNIKVFVLMAGLTALLIAIGGYFGGQSGMLFALVLAAGMNFFMYFGSDKMVLRAYRARVVDQSSAPELYALVDDLRRRAGLPMPTLAIAPQQQPNAFATGRNAEHAVVCVTEGMLRTVSRDETPVHLSAKEFDLLAYFMRHPGQVLSREQILNGVWDYNHDPGTNIVEVYVGYLRRKLALPDRPVPIQTVRSAGYRLVDG